MGPTKKKKMSPKEGANEPTDWVSVAAGAWHVEWGNVERHRCSACARLAQSRHHFGCTERVTPFGTEPPGGRTLCIRADHCR